jgi:RecA-family ATPase
MDCYEVIENKLNEGMVQGQMHTCLRDIGRLAGGYAAAGKLTASELDALGTLAAARSINAKEGLLKWRAAVEFGRRQPVTKETYTPKEPAHFGFDEPIWVGKTAPGLPTVNQVESRDIPEPAADWKDNDLCRYLESLFTPDERVGIVIQAWERDGKFLPQKGFWDKTQVELIAALRRNPGDIGAVLGDPNPEVGGWIRMNPLDGNGCMDANVTAYRHTLIEADDQDLGQQLALINELGLPCSAIVHSGGKSIHAIVRVDAPDLQEYRRRVDKLHEVCKKAGLKADPANRNPSRLSRLPGVMRKGNPQYLISGRCGLPDWEAWVTHIEELKDDLPDFENAEEIWKNFPPLSDEVIFSLLRKGHKLLLAGPSKAGKSFDLLELGNAIAEGRTWHGWRCRQGPVLYINLELDAASCWHRIRAVREELGLDETNLKNLEVWNLRGSSVSLDKLAPKLIRRALKRKFIAVVVDPIYKVLTGDENSAAEMAAFCNLFDKIALALGASIIYAHHHSKGSQGQKKAMDRSSGSGVFGRDPDAALDLIELEISEERREVLRNHAGKATLERFGSHLGLDLSGITDQQRGTADSFLAAIQSAFPQYAEDAHAEMVKMHEGVSLMSGWRIEGNLREFATPKPRVCWFKYPIHIEDHYGLLKDAKAAGEEPPWKAKQEAQTKAKAESLVARNKTVENAIMDFGGPGKATVKNLMGSLTKSDDTIISYIQATKKYTTYKGLIILKNKDGNDE